MPACLLCSSNRLRLRLRREVGRAPELPGLQVQLVCAGLRAARWIQQSYARRAGVSVEQLATLGHLSDMFGPCGATLCSHNGTTSGSRVSLTAVAFALEHCLENCFRDHGPHSDAVGASAAVGGSMWWWRSSSAQRRLPPHLDGHAGAVEALGEQHVLALQLVVRACEHQLRSTGPAASSFFCRHCLCCFTREGIRTYPIALSALGASANTPSPIASQRPERRPHHCQRRLISQVQRITPSGSKVGRRCLAAC